MKYDEQIIADFLRVLHKLDKVTTQQLVDQIDVLQIRLFASEKGMTVDELLNHVRASKPAKTNGKPNPLPQSPSSQSSPKDQ